MRLQNANYLHLITPGSRQGLKKVEKQSDKYIKVDTYNLMRNSWPKLPFKMEQKR